MTSARDLCRPSPYRWTELVLCDWLWIAAAAYLAHDLNTLWAYWLASLVIGNRAHALAIMGHDGAHHTASSNRTLNDVLTAGLVFWPLGISLRGYRAFHFAHHRLTGTPLDTELPFKNNAPGYRLPMTRRRLVRWVLHDLTGLSAFDAVRLSRLTLPRERLELIGPVAVQLTVAAACLGSGNGWLLALWWFSLATSFLACFRLRAWTEHVGTTSTHRIHLSWWQRALFAPHWTWYHWEHHVWPSVPCWLLPDARLLDDLRSLTLGELIDILEDADAQPD